jgi:creatinine amidohydrolase
MPAIYLADLPGSAVAAALARAPLAILPLGSVEYHGPHGALGTDLFLAEEMARRVGGALEALVLPTVPFAHCPPDTRGYPGTLTVGEETMTRYLEEILAGVFGHGLRVALALNAHDGNIRPLQAAGDRLAERFPDRTLLLVNWWEGLPAAVVEPLGFFSQRAGHGHGGPLEISAAAAARPGTADLAAARDLDLAAAPGEGAVRAVLWGRPRPNWAGYHGRATEATEAKGAQLLAIASERIVADLRAWLKLLGSAVDAGPDN